jgi:CheY-like chemotaxis protein
VLRTFSRHVNQGDVQLPHNQEELVPGTYVVVEVSDNGEGMDAETIARIFDPFFTTKFVGRGLGLSAVLGILRGHRGGVEIVSAPGRGSTFRVFLPALLQSERVAGATPVSSAPIATSESSGLVIVVDDEHSVRRLATAVLTRAGYQVLSAGDGIKALALIDDHCSDIAVVLLDMMMPRMNGEETLGELRKRHPMLPVLLSSGYTEEVAAQKLLTDPHVRFVQKPYGAADLLAAIRSLSRKAELASSGSELPTRAGL